MGLVPLRVQVAGLSGLADRVPQGIEVGRRGQAGQFSIPFGDLFLIPVDRSSGLVEPHAEVHVTLPQGPDDLGLVGAKSKGLRFDQLARFAEALEDVAGLVLAFRPPTIEPRSIVEALLDGPKSLLNGFDLVLRVENLSRWLEAIKPGVQVVKDGSGLVDEPLALPAGIVSRAPFGAEGLAKPNDIPQAAQFLPELPPLRDDRDGARIRSSRVRSARFRRIVSVSSRARSLAARRA